MTIQSNNIETVYFDFALAKKCFPVKIVNADKKTYGKTLVIAGSKNIYGASYLCAKSCFLAGAGMVKVFTHKNNMISLEHDLPEAMYSFYNNIFLRKNLQNSIVWADTVVVGPGLGFSYPARRILKCLPKLLKEKQILVLDADALNILSRNKSLYSEYVKYIEKLQLKCVITPHKDELKRLIKGLYPDMTEEEAIEKMTQQGIVVVKKGSNTHTFGKRIYINDSGNEGMATAGSGDVLSGILGGTLFRCATVSFDKRVAFGVFLHGLAGDLCKKTINTVSMTATDIMGNISEAFDSLEKG